MGKFGGNAIFGPKMSIFDHFRGGGRSSNLVRYKPFGQVNHNIIGTKELKGSKKFGEFRRGFGILEGLEELRHFQPF